MQREPEVHFAVAESVTSFVCASGTAVIMKRFVCDGLANCDDGSDEDVAACYRANGIGRSWTSTSHVIAAVLLGCIMGTIVVCWVLVSFAECLLNAYRYSRWCTERLVRASRRSSNNGCRPQRSSSLPPSLQAFFRRSTRRNRMLVRRCAPSRGGRRESCAELVPFVSAAEPPEDGSCPTFALKLSAAAAASSELTQTGSGRETLGTSKVMSVLVQTVAGDETNARSVAVTMPEAAAAEPGKDFIGMDADCRQQLMTANEKWQPRMTAVFLPGGLAPTGRR